MASPAPSLPSPEDIAEEIRWRSAALKRLRDLGDVQAQEARLHDLRRAQAQLSASTDPGREAAAQVNLSAGRQNGTHQT